MFLTENSKSDKYYADCQLVAAVNAYYYLTGNVIKQDSNRYKELLELGGCVYGSCINIKKVWKELGIWEDKKILDIYDLKDCLSENCFIATSIWHIRYGNHIVSIVDYIEKADCIKVLNFKYKTTIDNWIFWEDFRHFIVENPNKDNTIGRTFKLL
jgi:hypothetical protein